MKLIIIVTDDEDKKFTEFLNFISPGWNVVYKSGENNKEGETVYVYEIT